MGEGEAETEAARCPQAAAEAGALMRIIGGLFRGRRLVAPKGRSARPTADRVRESLFNILAHGDAPPLAGARVADLFAGTGAFGLEALSRGAAHVHFIEHAPQSLAALRTNVATLGLGGKSTILARDVRHLPEMPAPFDLVFLDPPYREGLIPVALAVLRRRSWIGAGSLIVAEAAQDEALALPEGFHLRKARTIGPAQMLFIGHAVG